MNCPRTARPRRVNTSRPPRWAAKTPSRSADPEGIARSSSRCPSVKPEPLNFECPAFVINTDNGYQSLLEGLMAEIDAMYSRPKIHELDRHRRDLVNR